MLGLSINPFHTTCLYLYPADFREGKRKRPLALSRLKMFDTVNEVSEVRPSKKFAQFKGEISKLGPVKLLLLILLSIDA